MVKMVHDARLVQQQSLQQSLPTWLGVSNIWIWFNGTGIANKMIYDDISVYLKIGAYFNEVTDFTILRLNWAMINKTQPPPTWY
jgi:hypothetical protein